MKKVLFIILTALIAFGLFACSSATPKKTKATLKNIDLAGHLLKAKRKGKLKTFHITQETKFSMGDEELKAGDLKEGDKVELEYKMKNKKRALTKVDVLSRSKTSGAENQEAVKPDEGKSAGASLTGEAKPGETKPELKPAKKPSSEDENDEGEG